MMMKHTFCDYTNITNKTKCLFRIHSCRGGNSLSNKMFLCDPCYHGNSLTNNGKTIAHISRLRCVMKPSLSLQQVVQALMT